MNAAEALRRLEEARGHLAAAEQALAGALADLEGSHLAQPTTLIRGDVDFSRRRVAAVLAQVRPRVTAARRR